VLTYRAFGFGARGSAVYIDPATDPWLFARAAFERGPLLLMGQWSLPSHLHGVLSENAGRGLWLFACGLVVVLALFLAPLVRGAPLARFFALGMLLSLVPSCATFPHDRLLFLAGFGGFGLLALFLGGLWQGASWLPRAKARRVGAHTVGALLVAFHLVIAPIGLLLAPSDLRGFGDLLETAAASLPEDSAIRTQDAVIVHTPSAFVSFYGLPIRALAGRPVPARLLVLASSVHGVTIERPTRNTLLIRPEGGFLNPHGRPLPGRDHAQLTLDFRYVLALLDGLYRENPTMRLGERIDLSGLTIEIVALTDDGHPAEVRFAFDRNLDDSSLRWLRWEAGVYVPFALPAVGESVTLPAPAVPFG
jgi:hypothetical protein